MDDARRIIAADEVPSDGTVLFTARNGSETTEVILTKLADDEIVAFENFCPHWTDIRLDKGSGAYVRNGELVCEKHGATFQRDTGYCDFGPCEGSVLSTFDVAVQDGDVFLTEEEFTFEHLGGTGDHDRSSGGRIDFTGN
ncbi:Rieske 2Fe-2S domain-containing protein [Halogeometricum borinquense]|uniref:Rieske 2Fe-2S domain-containing protein n=1 Tax=Halogeometricum borinquense TaxID=60847 RepID=A0A6C0UDW2_9EURY|nr:Rieske 2Fe-2S domain-containing protein [Halogeometricum borinquense]QIB73337.1 Rieske 2Fe-2S domain-containing protein [Halogeometricum borinquense]QIQ77265.1 Rieske 2Fe-2S domain-containing protein [Halogeometricum borinquense]